MSSWEEKLMEAQYDAGYDAHMEELYLDQLYEETIQEFSLERLQSYYIQNPNVIDPAKTALVTAQNLESVEQSAALVFAAIALEIGIKSAILTPMVNGLVSNESLANIIARFTIGRGSPKVFKDLLLSVLKEQVGIDLEAEQRPGSSNSIWSEVSGIVTKRNKIMHTGETVAQSEASNAVGTAKHVIASVFPKVIANLGLTTDQQLHISAK